MLHTTAIGQLPRVSRQDPERIRVDSVVETCVLFVCKQTFSFFLLSFFSFYTVQYRRVQYSTVIYWPAPSSIQRGLEWTQLLKRLIVCSLCAWLSANFLIFPSFILLFLYSTVQKSAVQYSYWPAPLSIQRGLEWTQLLKRLSVCLIVPCVSANWPAPSSIRRGSRED